MKKIVVFAFLAMLLPTMGLAVEHQAVIYADIDCFNWPKVPQRLCIDWHITAEANGAIGWRCLVSGIAMKDELLTRQTLFDAPQKQQIISALEKGLSWCRIAHEHAVDVSKVINNIDGQMEIDFISDHQGRECWVRFTANNWFKQGPVSMFAPYAHTKGVPRSIQSLISALKTSQSQYKRLRTKDQKTDDLFR